MTYNPFAPSAMDARMRLRLYAPPLPDCDEFIDALRNAMLDPRMSMPTVYTFTAIARALPAGPSLDWVDMLDALEHARKHALVLHGVRDLVARCKTTRDLRDAIRASI